MQQVFAFTSVLKLMASLVVATSFANLAYAKPNASRPIEVLSDPYGYGVPTHYTILRGHTKITFTNPIFGQFTRAEIAMREQNGNRITRFTLSADAKSYRPTLIQFQPFEKHGYPDVDPFCLDPKAPSSILNVTALGPAVKESELIAKKRDELTKAKFFDASCFDPSIKEEHRNAIMNAAADIFTTETQVREDKSTFLRCLEDTGFAHESGVIQAFAKQAISEKNLNPRLRLSCTADKKAKSGEFDEQSKTITIKQSLKPDRDTYAAQIFHEALHSVPMRDGISTELIEECCTLGERCDELKKIGAARKTRDRETAILEPSIQTIPVATGTQTVLAGGDVHIASGELKIGSACKIAGKDRCATDLAVASIEFANAKQCKELRSDTSTWTPFHLLKLNAALASEEPCGPGQGIYGSGASELREIAQQHNAKTIAELAPHIPVTSPISWDVPQTPTPQANRDNETPTPPIRQSRTIASIAPLPEPSAIRSLGSATGRRDVSSTNRATKLVDTLETAARKVTTTLTLEKLDARRIETTEVFRSRPKDQPAQKLIVASLAGRPLQISNIADINDLSFPNPFANEKSEQRTQPAQPVNGLARTTRDAREDNSETRSPTASAIASAMVGSATEKLTQSSGLAPSMAGTHTASKFQTKDRVLNSSTKSTTHDFEKMTATELKRFVVGGYRAVAAELENQEFAKALSKNGIQIYDHENRQIGAMAPALVDGVLTHTVFIYSAEKSRLIQSRTSKRNPK